MHRFTLINSARPSKKNVNEKLQWFGVSLGLFQLRDKDKSTFRIFVELLKAAKAQRSLSSDELASRLSLTRGTVVHHLKKLMESGIVTAERNTYSLRADTLETLVRELEKDISRTCEDLLEVAKELDAMLNL